MAQYAVAMILIAVAVALVLLVAGASGPKNIYSNTGGSPHPPPARSSP